MRHQLLERLFQASYGPYAAIKSGVPWRLSSQQLCTWPEGTVGRALGEHLQQHGFELIDKVEAHDVVHLLLGYGVDVPSELALQFVMLGNGKRSAYCLTVVTVGGALYPDQWGRFRRAFREGRARPRFHDWAFRELLGRPLADVRGALSVG